MTNAWIDATMPFHPGMPVWPGQPAVEISRLAELTEPDSCDVSVLKTSVHTGTHMDAFSHFLRGGADITAMPPGRGIGPVRVVAVRGEPHVAAAAGVPLTLTGHTHGGQLMLPGGVGPGPVMYRYWSGVYEKPGSAGSPAAVTVVSNGSGNWFPLRTFAPAEVVCLVLRA